MNAVKIIICLFLSVTITNGSLSPPDKSYKILMLLPISSKSHRNVFMPLADALLERGHQVTMLSNHPLNHPKIKHYQHSMPHFDVDNMNMFEVARDPSKMFKLFEIKFPIIAKEIYDDAFVKDLYARRKEFDLLIIPEMFNDAMYPFALEHKFITISTGGLDPSHSAVMGNFLNPAYINNVLDNYPHPYSFLDRARNIFFSMMVPYNWHKSIKNPTQVEISKRFPKLPPISVIEANQSLSLLNSHFSFTKSVPLLPNQVEVGGMHCRPAKPLPEDLNSFVSGNTPVVYMSLGSVAKSEHMPKEYQEIFKTVFAKLPFKILWKYEDETVTGLPKNVMIKKWMPQQDVIAHPNVKVFISHCGLLGLQEAMYHATPILGLPIFGDQPRNGKALEYSGLGRMLTWDNLSVKILTETITDIIENPGYSKRISKVSASFRDQLESPVERAVYWTEYVIRHDGAVHLRSPELDLSWVQLLHLDLIFLLHLVVYFIYRILKSCFSKNSSKSSRKGKNKND